MHLGTFAKKRRFHISLCHRKKQYYDEIDPKIVQTFVHKIELLWLFLNHCRIETLLIAVDLSWGIQFSGDAIYVLKSTFIAWPKSEATIKSTLTRITCNFFIERVTRIKIAATAAAAADVPWIPLSRHNHLLRLNNLFSVGGNEPYKYCDNFIKYIVFYIQCDQFMEIATSK